MRPEQTAALPAVNRLQLEASIAERDAIRYTPAGVPIVSLVLHHRGEVSEAGVVRIVEMTLPAVAAGLSSGAVERLAFGQLARFIGFMAPKSRNARTLVFHITELNELDKD
ncbi:MAG: primosomal replication protein N [Janthinobacterium lividum]